MFLDDMHIMTMLEWSLPCGFPRLTSLAAAGEACFPLDLQDFPHGPDRLPRGESHFSRGENGFPLYVHARVAPWFRFPPRAGPFPRRLEEPERGGGSREERERLWPLAVRAVPLGVHGPERGEGGRGGGENGSLTTESSPERRAPLRAFLSGGAAGREWTTAGGEAGSSCPWCAFVCPYPSGSGRHGPRHGLRGEGSGSPADLSDDEVLGDSRHEEEVLGKAAGELRQV
jgi:hypothetical protein